MKPKSLDVCINELNHFIKHITLEYDYIPNSQTYCSISHSIFLLATKYAGFNKEYDKTYISPFHSLYNYINERFYFYENNSYSNQNFKEIIQNLITAPKRMQLLSHLCQFIEKMLKKLSLGNKIITIQSLFCYLLMQKLIQPKFACILEYSTSKFVGMFENNFNKSDIFILSSILQITYYVKPFDEQLYLYITSNLFNQLKQKIQKIYPKEEFLPDSVSILRYMLTQVREDKNIIQQIISLFYEHVLKIYVPSITSRLKSCNHLDVLLSNPNTANFIPLNSRNSTKDQTYEAKLLNVLSFVNRKETNVICEEFYIDTINLYKIKFENEQKIKIIAQYFLDILEITKNYNDIIENPIFDAFSSLQLISMLKNVKFARNIGSTYPICLSYVIDSFLKRGNIFRSTVKQSDLIKLVSYTSERDVFIKHYESNLFIRLATRATIGYEKEREFINSIAAVVQLENLSTAINILEECIEKMEIGVPDFTYIIIKKSTIPELPKEIGMMCPSAFTEKCQLCSDIFTNRWKERKFSWSVSLATCEGKIKTMNGISNIFMSLPQAAILLFISQNSNKASFEELYLILKIDVKTRLINILKTLVKTKILSCDKNLSQCEQGLFSINNYFHSTKAIIADNWKIEQPNVKDVTKNRSHALQALAVKIMKKNKIMKVSQLKEKISQAASFLFPATSNDISQALRILEINEYIEYSDENHVIYKE